MKTFSRESLLLAVILAVLLLIAAFGLLIYPAWVMNSHGFNLAGFEQVHTGMTMAQVENLLGKPTLTSSLEDGSVVWTYNKGSTWCIGHIQFRPDGKVLEKEQDH